MPVQEAILLASNQGLDLVEITPNSNPPVCQIIDFGKYKYEIQRKNRESQKNQKKSVKELKEIRMRPFIAENDFQVKLKSIYKFLQEGNRVRIMITFRGREITQSESGMAIMRRFKELLSELCKIEIEPKMEGRSIIMLITSK
jgi:translation initiation factor IF-3